MAIREELAEGVVRVGVEDYGVAEKLAALDAEFKAAMDAFGRQEATVKLKGNIDDLKRALAAGKAEIVKYDTEIAALEQKQTDTQSKAWKSRYDTQIKGLQDLRDAQALENRQIQSRQALQTTFFAQQQKMWAAEKAQSDLRNKQYAADNKQADLRRQQHVQAAKDAQEAINLESRYYDARKKVDDLERAAARAPASDKVRVNLDSAQATADMLRIRAELDALGRDPVKQEIKLDTSNAQKAWIAFTKGFGSNEFKKAIEDVDRDLNPLNNWFGKGAKINVGPFNASIGSVVSVLAAGAPVVAAFGGAVGALVGVLGSGIAGAAGLGGAALSGFGLAALGIKAAVSQSVQQLSTFKSQLNTFQTASLTAGPPGAKPTTPSQVAAASRRQAAIPIDQSKIVNDQAALTTAIDHYGSSSLQAARASTTLAGANLTLNNAQVGTATGANASSKALTKLNEVIKQSSPPMQAAERAWLSLSSVWSKLTGKTASRDVGAALSASFTAANANVQWFARDTNKALDAITVGWSRWMGALASPQGQTILKNLFGNFDKTIKPVMDGLGQLAAALGRWFSTMSNFLPGLAKQFDGWATGVNNASRATDGWNSHAGSMVQSLKDIGSFAKAALNWLTALFAPGVKPGQGFLEDMTKSLNRTADAMRSVSGQKDLQNFYHDSVKGTEQLFDALKPLGALFINLAALFAPIAKAAVPVLQFFTQMTANVVGVLGPFGTLLRDFAGLVLAGRLIGKLSPFGNFFKGLFGADGQIRKVMSAISAFAGADGGLKARASAASASWKASSASASQTIEEALKRGGPAAGTAIAEKMLTAGNEVALKFAEAIAKGTVTFEEGGKVAGDELATGVIAGAKVGAGELATGEKLGGLGAGGLGAAEKDIAGGGLLAKGRGLIGGGAAILGLSALISGATASGGLQNREAAAVSGATFGILPQSTANKGLSALSSHSSGIAEGAAIGSVVPVVGTIAGAVIGGILDQSTDWGKKAADSFSKGFGGANAKPLKDAVANLINKADSGVSGDVRAGNLQQAGALIAKTLEQGWNQYRFQDEPTMVKQLIAEIKNPAIPNAAKASAVASAEAFALNLEKEGKLAPKSAQNMLKAVENQFPQLKAYLGTTAKQAATAWNVGFNLQQSENNTKKVLNSIRGDFPQVVAAMDATKGGVQQKSAAVIKALKDIITYGTGPMRKQAKLDLDAIMNTADGDFTNITKSVHNETPKWVNTVSSNSKQAYQIGSANFTGLAKSIASAIGSGAEATAKGLQNITDQVNAQLKTFGGGKISNAQVGAASPGQLAALISGQVNAGGLTAGGGMPVQAGQPAGGHATGGRVPGPVGPDNWTLLDPYGRPAGMVGGNEILVANRHTENRVDQMLAPYGTSLDREVAGETRPHSQPMFATGGVLKAATTGAAFGPTAAGNATSPRAGSNYVSPFPKGTPIHWERLDAGQDMTVPPGTPVLAIADGSITGIDPGWFRGQPLIEQSVAGGPLSGKYLYYAEGLTSRVASGQSVHAGQVIGVTTSQPTGLEFGFGGGGTSTLRSVVAGSGDSAGPWSTSYSSLIHSLASGSAISVSGIPGGAGGSGAAVSWKDIKIPKVSGGGTVGAAVQMGLNRVAKAANAYGQKKAAASGGGGNAFTGTLSGPFAKEVYQFFSPNGFNKVAIAGIIGNALQESDYNWNAPGGGAWQQITNFGSGTGGSPLQQMSAMLPQIQGLKAALNAAGSPANAASIFMSGFEKPAAATANLARRQGGANAAFAAGYNKGGRVQYAGAFANGGAFTTNGPTVGLFGENGTPETVIAIPHAATGLRFGTRASSHAGSHKTTGNVHETAAQKEAQKERKYKTEAAKAKKAYENYLYEIEHNNPPHWSHWPSGKKKKYFPGGPTPSEKAHLHVLYKKWQEDARLAHLNPPTATFNTAEEIPPKDRIGGVGTDDIATALQNAQTAYQNAPAGKTKAAKQHKASLKDNVTKLQGLLNSASKYVQEFTDLETEIGLLGTYMDGASASGTDSFPGYDPGTGAQPKLGKKLVTKTWAQWKAIRMYWEHKHTVELEKAAADARQRLTIKKGKNKGKLTKDETALEYVRTLMGDAGTALSDEEALAGTTDSGGALADSSTYIQSLKAGAIPDAVSGETPEKELERLTYVDSLAQGLVQIDNPSTAVREDIVSMYPEDETAKELMGFYQQVLAKAQSDPATRGNYPLLTSLSDAANSAQSNWQNIDQTITQATQAIGPTQTQLSDTARAAALQSYGGNFNPIGSSAAIGGALAANYVSPAARPSAGGPPASATPNVNVTNHFAAPPPDAHTWSNALSWELQASL